MVSDERVPILGTKTSSSNRNHLRKNSPWNLAVPASADDANGAISGCPTGDVERTAHSPASASAADTTSAAGASAADTAAAASGKGSSKSFFSDLSSTKKGLLALLCTANVFACACFSLLAPFYPAEAAAKGLSQGTIGLVFSSYELCVFLTSPIFGTYMVHIGHRFAFLAGLFVAGGCSILFGTLYLAPAGLAFTVLSFVLRCLMAVGASAFITSSFTLVANEFPDSISIVFGALEVFTGVGYMLGPLLGGVLYELGGFGLPFFISGSLLMILTLVTFFLMPAPSNGAGRQSVHQRSVLGLAASPLVVVCSFTLMAGSYTFGYMDASLAIHLEEFNVSAAITGVCFMSMAAIYSLSSPFFGWLSDKKNISYSLLVFGCVIDAVALLLLGPTPLLPFVEGSLGLIIFSLLLLGIGTGAIIIPIIKCFYIGARRLGFEDGMALDGMLSGLFNSSLHFGTFLGPSIGSAIMQATNYAWSITMNSGLLFLAFLLLILYKVIEKSCLKYEDEEKLLSRPSENSSTIVLEPSSPPSTPTEEHTLISSPSSSSLNTITTTSLHPTTGKAEHQF